MSKQQKENMAEQPISADFVADYLKANHDFFSQFPDLLCSLQIPHDSGQAVSLVERQLQVLRDENSRLKARFKELVDVASDNEALIRSMHRLTLQLMEATSPGQILSTLGKQLSESFSADSIHLRIFAEPAFLDQELAEEFVGKGSPLLSRFNDILNADMPFSGRLNQEQQASLYGDDGSQQGSVVIVPLHAGHWQGLLAIGSDDPARYQPGMGVDLLVHLGDVLSLILDPWVKRPQSTAEE